MPARTHRKTRFHNGDSAPPDLAAQKPKCVDDFVAVVCSHRPRRQGKPRLSRRSPSFEARLRAISMVDLVQPSLELLER